MRTHLPEHSYLLYTYRCNIRNVPRSVAPAQSTSRRRLFLLASIVVIAFTSLLAAIVLLNPTLPTGPGDTAQPPTETLIGLHVPWAIGGNAIERDGSLTTRSPEWPDIPVEGVRLWDTRTAWLNLEPRQDQWDFSNLDAHLQQAKSHGVRDITLVLWGTPAWAASKKSDNDAHWLGLGSASMPTDINDWVDFVHKVVSRYRGQISAYEIGNEPNLDLFWNGTDAELARLVQSAAGVIHEIDPQATVVAPAPVLTNVGPLQQRSAHSYWPLLTQDANGNPLHPSQQVDALSFHWYPQARVAPEELGELVERLRKQAIRAGLGHLPLWLTEVNYRSEGLRPREQQAQVERTNTVIEQLGIPKAYWYAWTDLGPQSLMQFQPGFPASAGLALSLGQRNTTFSPS